MTIDVPPPTSTPLPDGAESERPSLDGGPGSMLSPIPVPDKKTWVEEKLLSALEQVGDTSILFAGSIRVLFKRPLEIPEIVTQMESIGVKSTALVLITGLFVGMVMALQFALGLQKFGGMEYTGRVIALSFTRELAPTLTAVIVGGRIGAGIAAELGSMNVTEQVDAIRALGADPVKKLVMPRLVATTIIMPVLSMFSLCVGFFGAMMVTTLQFGIPAGFFMSTSLDSVYLSDFWSGFLKTPFFGAIIALVGCHFGLRTRGGTQGVGRSTTQTVVVVSVAILIADFALTNVYAWVFPK